MMDTDDLEPRKLKPKRRDLEQLSIDELESYIEEMKAEIVRVQAAIAQKRDHRSGADAFFKKR